MALRDCDAKMHREDCKNKVLTGCGMVLPALTVFRFMIFFPAAADRSNRWAEDYAVSQGDIPG